MKMKKEILMVLLMQLILFIGCAQNQNKSSKKI